MNQKIYYLLKYYIFYQGHSWLIKTIIDRLKRMKSSLTKSTVSYRNRFSYCQLKSILLDATKDIHVVNDVVVNPDGFIWKNDSIVDGIVPYYNVKPYIQPNIGNRIPNALFCASPVNTLNYYHWLIDVMPIFLKGKSIELSYPCITHSPLNRFQREMSTLCNLNLQAIAKPTSVEKLAFIPCWEASYPPKWAIEILQQSFQHIGETSTKPWRLLLLDRRKSYRHLLNQEQIFEALQPLGFELLDPGNLTVQEQIAMFREARAVVSCHGAGLTNLIFMQPETLCVEIGYRHKREHQLHYENLARLCQINHSWIDVSHPYLPSSHMVIEPQLLVKHLSKCI